MFPEISKGGSATGLFGMGADTSVGIEGEALPGPNASPGVGLGAEPLASVLLVDPSLHRFATLDLSPVTSIDRPFSPRNFSASTCMPQWLPMTTAIAHALVCYR